MTQFATELEEAIVNMVNAAAADGRLLDRFTVIADESPQWDAVTEELRVYLVRSDPVMARESWNQSSLTFTPRLVILKRNLQPNLNGFNDDIRQCRNLCEQLGELLSPGLSAVPWAQFVKSKIGTSELSRLSEGLFVGVVDVEFEKQVTW